MYTYERRRLSDTFERHVAQATPKKVCIVCIKNLYKMGEIFSSIENDRSGENQ